MSQPIDEGGTFEKDADEQRVISFDWGTRGLDDGVTIATSLWLIDDQSDLPDQLLTNDNPSISADQRTTQTRFKAGTVDHKYKVTNRIVTGETPAQTIDGVFYIRVKVKK